MHFSPPTPCPVLVASMGGVEDLQYPLTRAHSLSLSLPSLPYLMMARCYKVTSCDAAVRLRRASHFSLEEMQVSTQRRNSGVKWRMFTEAKGAPRETVGPLPSPCAWQIVFFVYCRSQIIRCLKANVCVRFRVMPPRGVSCHLAVTQRCPFVRLPQKSTWTQTVSKSLEWEIMWTLAEQRLACCQIPNTAHSSMQVKLVARSVCLAQVNWRTVTAPRGFCTVPVINTSWLHCGKILTRQRG